MDDLVEYNYHYCELRRTRQDKKSAKKQEPP